MSGLIPEIKPKKWAVAWFFPPEKQMYAVMQCRIGK